MGSACSAPAPDTAPAVIPRQHCAARLALFTLSGAAGLLYQVLWQRQVALIVGNTAHAAAATLAGFFLGLALGSWLWGERAASADRPLRTYAALELAVAATAVLGLALPSLYRTVLPYLGAAPLAAAAATVALVAALLLPPTICMGGTFPMMGQDVIRGSGALGRTGPLLYAANALGGAGGAIAAAFWLPAALGSAGATLAAAALSALVGILALALDQRAVRTPASPAAAAPARTARLSPRAALALAALAGASGLGLEVLWTRMLALVLHNSAQSFAVVLTVVLGCLALGAALAARLTRSARPPLPTLVVLLLGAGAAAALSPRVFRAVTDGFAAVAPNAGWPAYLAATAATTTVAIAVPGALAGAVFPFLLHALRPDDPVPGRALGRLNAANTLGAIAGALLTGFVLLDALGLWPAIETLALLYLAAAAWLAPRVRDAPALLRAAPLAALLLVATILDPSRIPSVRLAPGEALLGVWESAAGVTAVVERDGVRRLTLDGHYPLGGTGAMQYEQTQADLPLLLHAHPRAVLCLGLGTGITAGATLRHPIASLTVIELVPDVIEAARAHFAPFTNRLFTDPRVQVLAGDARSALLGRDDRFDVVIGDLFVPWQPGAASLYTREHFTTVRERLAPDGLFAQWLPLYQLSRDEFLVIARTMLEVFPQVTLWRGDFLPDRPVVAVVGHREATPLDPDRLVESVRRREGGATVPRADAIALTGLLYAGNLGAARALLHGHVVSTDDWPALEFSSPVTQRQERVGAAQWLTHERLGEFLVALAERVPPDADPFLARLDGRGRDYVTAGRELFLSRIARATGRDDEADQRADAFAHAVPFAVYRLFAERPPGAQLRDSTATGAPVATSPGAITRQ